MNRKSDHTLLTVGGVLISLSKTYEPVGGEPLMSVASTMLDVQPYVTFPACTGTKLILLGDRGTFDKNLQKAASKSAAAENPTHKPLITNSAAVQFFGPSV